MRVRLATPAGAVLLSCLLRTPQLLRLARVTGAARCALGAAVGQVPRDLAAHRYYHPSEP